MTLEELSIFMFSLHKTSINFIYLNDKSLKYVHCKGQYAGGHFGVVLAMVTKLWGSKLIFMGMRSTGDPNIYTNLDPEPLSYYVTYKRPGPIAGPYSLHGVDGA